MMWNVDKKIRKKRTEELLASFELTTIRKKRNEDLSIGQRRRVQVAREFMHDMDLLFLDEPTVGLDPSARRKLLDFLKTTNNQGQIRWGIQKSLAISSARLHRQLLKCWCHLPQIPTIMKFSEYNYLYYGHSPY